jgi:DNA-binding protein H-NS
MSATVSLPKNLKNLTPVELATAISTVQSFLTLAQAEQADREKHTRDLKSWMAGSAGRMEAARALIDAPAIATNGTHKASATRKARPTKKVVAKRAPRQAYKVPGEEGRIWKGYGPAPKSLSALPKEQWAQYAVTA